MKNEIETLQELAEWLGQKIDELKKLNEKSDLSAKYFFEKVFLENGGWLPGEEENKWPQIFKFAEQYHEWRKSHE